MNMPRRIRLDLNTTAELAIRNAVDQIEKIGVDTRLTDAINLLHKAKELVSDYIDKVPSSIPSERGEEERELMEQLDIQAIGKELNIGIGQTIVDKILPAIKATQPQSTGTGKEAKRPLYPIFDKPTWDGIPDAPTGDREFVNRNIRAIVKKIIARYPLVQELDIEGLVTGVAFDSALAYHDLYPIFNKHPAPQSAAGYLGYIPDEVREYSLNPPGIPELEAILSEVIAEDNEPEAGFPLIGQHIALQAMAKVAANYQIGDDRYYSNQNVSARNQLEELKEWKQATISSLQRILNTGTQKEAIRIIQEIVKQAQ